MSSIEQLGAGLATGLVINIATFVVGALSTWLWNRYIGRRREITNLKEKLKEVEQANQRLQGRIASANKAVEGNGVWISKPAEFPSNYHNLSQSIPIITIANLKGGVGKTTTTANLAWFFAQKGKRVLCIDMDFQGTLSEHAAIDNSTNRSRVCEFVSGERFGDSIIENAWPFRDAGIENSYILTAGYGLAQTENKMLVHWLTGSETRDIRYFLAETLLSEDVQKNDTEFRGYDIVLIDAAPRLTTGTVQALCASTHLLIPTILDKMSVDAVRYFLEQYFTNIDIWPQLKLMGILGTMTETDIGKYKDSRPLQDLLKDYEEDALKKMQVQALQVWEARGSTPPPNLFFPEHTFIPDKVGFGRAARDGLATLNLNGNEAADIRAVFERLGQEVANRVQMAI